MIALRTAAALAFCLVAFGCKRAREPTATSDRNGAPRKGTGSADANPSVPAPCNGITKASTLDGLRGGMMGMGGVGGMGNGMRGMSGMHGMGGQRGAAWPDLDVWLIGAELSGDPTAPRPNVDDALRARGAELYAKNCATCHGTRGDGKGPVAPMLATPPQDLTTGVYKLRTTPHDELPTDEDLFRTISRGMHGTAMIPWTNLSEPDRWALVAQLKTISPDFAEEPAPTPISVPEPPAETPGLLAHGKQLFQSAGCASCHGPDGTGNGPAAALLRDSVGRPVHPTDLTGHRYRRGALVSEIYVTLRTGLDGTPMAPFASTLSADDTWAIATYVHSIAPTYVVTEGGVACPLVANLDPWELQGAHMATMAMSGHMARRMGW